MSQKLFLREMSAVALILFAGCDAGMKPSATAQTAVTKSRTIPEKVKALPVATQVPSAVAKPTTKEVGADQGSPKVRTTFYRSNGKPAAMPHVLLSKKDEAACKVKVGDPMPAIELPKLGQANKTKLAELFGKNATVVVFWKGDRRMSQQQLADVRADIVEPFQNRGVSVVGVSVDESAKDAEANVKKSGTNFPNLHDADGKAFAQVGSGRFPRTYVLDPGGKIVWFDIEYSLATRRELHQALEAITGGK
jgi:peroxiredoxin